MAAPGRCCLRRLLAQFPSHIFPRIDQRTSVVPCLGSIPLSIRPYAAAKKKVDQFVGTILLPFPFASEINKVMVFTEKEEEIKIAKENGAAFAGGTELIQMILDDEINADFYIAVPEIIAKLLPLKNKLRKKFPKTNRNSLGRDIPKMLELFKAGHEYTVEKENLIVTRIAMLDMPNEQIIANLDAIIKDVCTYRPLSYGPFVQRLIIRSSTSEGLQLNLERFLPRAEEVDKEDVKETEAPR